MATTFISGASRGLGLALATRFAARDGARVYAGARHPDRGELAALAARSGGRIVPVRLDVDDPASIAAAAAIVADAGVRIDTLVNSAGIANAQELGAVVPADFMAVLATNVAGPMLVTQALRPSLGRGSRIVNITSRLGSIADADGTWGYAYPASKAALNMISKQLAEALASDGILVLALHPGWVRTEMGGENATLGVDESADGMLRVIDGLTAERSGAFLQWDGEALPW